MREDLLLRLADLLEADAANPNGVKFNLDHWAVDAGMPEAEIVDRGNFLFPLDTKVVPLDCRTAACAMGLAALSGAFKDDGLDWRITGGGYVMPTFRNIDEGFQAAEALFQISYRQAECLFASEFYPDGSRKGHKGELAVAKRIRDFVDGKYTALEDD